MTLTVDEREPARAAFAEWAARQPGAPREADSLIDEVDVTYEHVGLLATEIHGRRVIWKSVPAGARERVTLAPVALDAIDAWNVEPRALRQRSDHIASCETCGGEKKISCPSCRGLGTRVCGACNGQRKMYGYAANGSRRLLNCASCRGKGELDCADCRRGTATCPRCAGEGRLQRWIELEAWQRSVSSAHPDAWARGLGWSGNATNATIARDADVVSDIDRPHSLTRPDLGAIPAEWVANLAPALQPGERIARQHLRIARIPVSLVRYHVGGDEELCTFTGRRLIPPSAGAPSAFARRASKLRSTLLVLFAIGFVAALVSLGRGAFFRSLPTLLSLLALAVTLGAIYGAVAEATAARRRTRGWLNAAVLAFIAAVAFAIDALPRLDHARALIVERELDRAESELNVLGDDAGDAWAELRLARIRDAQDVAAARALLTQIPDGSAHHAAAIASIDDLILARAADAAREHEWPSGAEMLALLSDAARRRPDSISTAKAVYLPLAADHLARKNWSGAANAIDGARGVGVADPELAPFASAIRVRAEELLADARREDDASRRLHLRLEAEQTLVAWERATDTWGTPPLIALRTAMAKDVAAVERAQRRRR